MRFVTPVSFLCTPETPLVSSCSLPTVFSGPCKHSQRQEAACPKTLEAPRWVNTGLEGYDSRESWGGISVVSPVTLPCDS